MTFTASLIWVTLIVCDVGSVTKAFDVLIALGTHQPMSEEAICGRLDISTQERRDTYGAVKFFNHQWDNPAALKSASVLRVVVDRLKVAPDAQTRITDSIETAYAEGGGAAWAIQLPESDGAPVTHQFSERFECRYVTAK